MDELARAYAALELSAGSSLEEVRRRYKVLVRKWHPDRFVSDPQGYADAMVKMRAINDAFRCVVGNHVFPAAEARVSTAPGSSQVGWRLTQKEIDRMVKSMGHQGRDWIFFDEQEPPLDADGWRIMGIGVSLGIFLVLLAQALGLF